MQELAALIKMFDGSPSEKHTLEVGLEDLRRWYAEIERLRNNLLMSEGCSSLATIGVDAHGAVVELSKETMGKLIAAEKEIVRLRAALELIAGKSSDKLQSMQARSALDNIGPRGCSDGQ